MNAWTVTCGGWSGRLSRGLGTAPLRTACKCCAHTPALPNRAAAPSRTPFHARPWLRLRCRVSSAPASAAPAEPVHVVTELYVVRPYGPALVVCERGRQVDVASVASCFRVPISSVRALDPRDLLSFQGYPLSAVPPLGLKPQPHILIDKPLQHAHLLAFPSAQDEDSAAFVRVRTLLLQPHTSLHACTRCEDSEVAAVPESLNRAAASEGTTAQAAKVTTLVCDSDGAAGVAGCNGVGLGPEHDDTADLARENTAAIRQLPAPWKAGDVEVEQLEVVVMRRRRVSKRLVYLDLLPSAIIGNTGIFGTSALAWAHPMLGTPCRLQLALEKATAMPSGARSLMGNTLRRAQPGALIRVGGRPRMPPEALQAPATELTANGKGFGAPSSKRQDVLELVCASLSIIDANEAAHFPVPQPGEASKGPGVTAATADGLAKRSTLRMTVGCGAWDAGLAVEGEHAGAASRRSDESTEDAHPEAQQRDPASEDTTNAAPAAVPGEAATAEAARQPPCTDNAVHEARNAAQPVTAAGQHSILPLQQDEGIDGPQRLVPHEQRGQQQAAAPPVVNPLGPVRSGDMAELPEDSNLAASTTADAQCTNSADDAPEPAHTLRKAVGEGEDAAASLLQPAGPVQEHQSASQSASDAHNGATDAACGTHSQQPQHEQARLLQPGEDPAAQPTTAAVQQPSDFAGANRLPHPQQQQQQRQVPAGEQEADSVAAALQPQQQHSPDCDELPLQKQQLQQQQEPQPHSGTPPLPLQPLSDAAPETTTTSPPAPHPTPPSNLDRSLVCQISNWSAVAACDAKVHLVNNLGALQDMHQYLLHDALAAEVLPRPPSDQAYWGKVPVGLDCEWQPYNVNQAATPVAVLQVATRQRVFLVDTQVLCRSARVSEAERLRSYGGRRMELADGANQSLPWPLTHPQLADITPEEAAFSDLLNDLFRSPHLVKIGFVFHNDLHALLCSFPHLPVFRGLPVPTETPFHALKMNSNKRQRSKKKKKGGGRTNQGHATFSPLAPGPVTDTLDGPECFQQLSTFELQSFVDIHVLAKRCRGGSGWRGKHIALGALVHQLLGQTLDKTAQRSAWATRPLVMQQMQYAARDAHVLVCCSDQLMCGATTPVGLDEADTKRDRRLLFREMFPLTAPGRGGAMVVTSPAAAHAFQRFHTQLHGC